MICICKICILCNRRVTFLLWAEKNCRQARGRPPTMRVSQPGLIMLLYLSLLQQSCSGCTRPTWNCITDYCCRRDTWTDRHSLNWRKREREREREREPERETRRDSEVLLVGGTGLES